jgi:RNA polymerase sigma-70 factor (ECF subfamily)
MAAVGQMVDRAGLTGVLPAERANASDEALVRAAQSGDRSAFGALYERYSRIVHGILLARVPRPVAEDLLQDVFLQALPRLASLREVAKFGGWLAAIARNRANDYYRRAKPVEEWNEGVREASGGWAGGADVADGLFLLEAVRSLPEAYRETLILRFVEGLTGPEIAEKTGLKHGSVRVNLYRGMQMLREKLEKRAARHAPGKGQ